MSLVVGSAVQAAAFCRETLLTAKAVDSQCSGTRTFLLFMRAWLGACAIDVVARCICPPHLYTEYWYNIYMTNTDTNYCTSYKIRPQTMHERWRQNSSITLPQCEIKQNYWHSETDNEKRNKSLKLKVMTYTIIHIQWVLCYYIILSIQICDTQIADKKTENMSYI